MNVTHKKSIWLSGAALLLAIGVALGFWSFRQVGDAARERSQAYIVIVAANELMSELLNAETGQRGYLLTGNETYLDPYLRSSRTAVGQLQALRQMTKLPSGLQQLDVLAPLVDLKLAELASSIALRRNNDAIGALAAVIAGDGKATMDSIRIEHQRFIDLEETALQQRDAAFQTRMQNFFNIIVAASVLFMGFALALVYFIRRQSQQRLNEQVQRETLHLLTLQTEKTLELQKLYDSLQVTEEKLSVTLNSIGDGVMATDFQGRVTLLNPLAQQLTGWTQEQAQGRSVDEIFRIINKDTRQTVKAPVMTTLSHGTVQVLSNHTVLIARTGTECDIADSCAPIRDRGGQVVGAVLVFRDVTERYRLDRVLQDRNDELGLARLVADKANLAKSEFLTTMSHEIRTPMNGVIGMIDVLLQSQLNTAQVEMVGIIHDSAFALLAVINDILDFSKIEANKLEIESIPLSITDVVEGACENMSHMALKKNVELSMFVHPATPTDLLGDPGRMRQILINLINNAIKFSSTQKRSGQVSVRALVKEQLPDRVVMEFHVADNGIGIDAATRERLFTAFTQADSTTTRIYGGTGLGLAITRQLVGLMGGGISVQSEPGNGSLFTVSASFALQPGADHIDLNLATLESEASVIPLLKGLRCLVLVDHVSTGADISTYLSWDHAEVEAATTQYSARQWIAKCPPGLCVVVIDKADTAAALDDLRVAARGHPNVQIHYVTLRRGKRQGPRRRAPDQIEVGGNVLSRKVLLRAVAIAAGRAALADDEVVNGSFHTSPTPLTRVEARRSGSLILVAEDNYYNQKVIQQQLTLLGQTADIANNGREAFERWQSGDYGILFADLHMPLMDGYELTAAIRSAEAGASRIPIIAFTANTLKGEAERCLAIGMDDYLSKPVQLVQLKSMLDKWQPFVSNETMPAGLFELTAPHPASSVVASDLAVDVRELVALVGSDPATLREFLSDFRVSQSKIALDLRCACAVGHAQTAGSFAHQLKSSARSVGALALGDWCGVMEKMGNTGDVAGLEKLMPRFDRELASVDRFLENYLDVKSN